MDFTLQQMSLPRSLLGLLLAAAACDGGTAPLGAADAQPDGLADGGGAPDAVEGIDAPAVSIQVFEASAGLMCLAEVPRDTDAAAGLQPDCWVTQQFPTGPNTYREVTVSACSRSALPPCWRLVSVLTCPGSGLSLELDRGSGAAAPGSMVAIYCRRY